MRNVVLILTCTVVIVVARSAARGDAPRQQAAHLDKQVQVKLDYLVYLPPDYDSKASWPLLVFLHGAGERGDDLELVKKHGPPKLIEEGKQFPFIVVSPQCPKDGWWTSKPLELTVLVDEIEAKYKVDKDRIYLTGLSMGGFGTWMLAGYTPERFAALVPICGGGDTLTARRLGNVPIWVFHGAKDPVVPLTALGRNGRGGEAQQERAGEVHRLSRGLARLVDGDVRQSRVVRMAIGPTAQAGGQRGAVSVSTG